MSELRRWISSEQIRPRPAEVFKVNQDDRAWVNHQCTVQPIATFQQPIALTGGRSKIENIVYVRASGFVEGSPFPPFEAKARAAGWKVVEIECGHDVMLDRPRELVATLIAADRESS